MYSAALPPFPSSWYLVAFSDELLPGKVVARKVAGQERVLFRTAAGSLGCLDAYCPHLGAHLGHGGTVDGEALRCPFHGFCFDAAGRCVRTGYGTRPPPRARARAWPVIERHGVVLTWYGPDGGEPSFQIPDADTSGFTPLKRGALRVRGHVQEVVENSVDIGHFTWIHGYGDFVQHGDLTLDGAYLNARYSLRRARRAMGRAQGFCADFEVHQYGLGYARVEVVLPELGMRTRQLVMPRPIDEDTVELVTAMSIRQIEDPAKIHPLLSFVPRRLLTRLVAAASFREYQADILQDRKIWEHKIYLQEPALAEGDGPIGRYRRWARQFHDP